MLVLPSWDEGQPATVVVASPIIAPHCNDAERRVKIRWKSGTVSGRPQRDVIDDAGAIASGTPYFEYFVAGTAYASAVLVRCGEPGETMGGLSRERLLSRAVRMIEAVAREHRLGGGSKEWSTFNSARIVHVLGMAAWLPCRYLVYSNSSPETKLVPDGKESVPLAPKTSGWVTRPGF